MNIIECGGQRSAEWFQNHIGVLGSSRIADAIAKRKRDPNIELQCRIDLRLEMAVERITNKTSEHFVSIWMERGIEMEPLARAAYELRRDVEVKQVDLVLHDMIHWGACSPDGLCGDDGLIEIKVPKPTTHAEYMLGECVPELYVPQMLWQMACTGRQFNEFVSYCPDFPEPHDLFICRLPRDDKRIGEMEREAEKFLEEVEVIVKRLKGGTEALLCESIGRAARPSLADA